MTTGGYEGWLEELDTFKAGMRQHQSQGPLFTAGGAGRIGDYGFDPEAFDSMARQAGYAGARPSDTYAQGAIAGQKFTQDFNEFGNWMLTAISWEYGHDIAVQFATKEAYTPEAIIGLGYPRIGNWVKALAEQIAFSGGQFTDQGVVRFLGPDASRGPGGAQSFMLPEMTFVSEQAPPQDAPPTYDQAATQLRSILTGMRNAGRNSSVRTASGIKTQEVGEAEGSGLGTKQTLPEGIE